MARTSVLVLLDDVPETRMLVVSLSARSDDHPLSLAPPIRS
jgi:hypothetical protein